MATTTTPLADEGPAADALNVRPRLGSIDLLRGIVMVLMVLDHTREYLTDVRLDPTDLARTTPALFLTRWITHFCAPVFVFLAGTGAFLSAARGKATPQLSAFLWTRGLWLIVLEFTLVKYGIFFQFVPGVFPALVIWAIGCSMVVLSALVFLPTRVVGFLGVLMIVTHNLFDGVKAASLGALGPLWVVLHDGGMVTLPGGAVLMVGYPLIPWIGVMAAGFAFGELLLLKPERRRRLLLGLGLFLTLAFVALRATNLYGDPRPWTYQKDVLFTLFSFVNCQKYPPSLLYLLMTLGPAIAALPLLERVPAAASRPLVTFGRVPLFYYLLQWSAAHGLAVLLNAARGQPTDWLFAFPPFQSPPGTHYSLATVYLAWAFLLLVLYPPCRWFAELKRSRRDPWLSYL